MRKIITLLVTAAVTFVSLALTACSESEDIDDYNWEKYVDICEYKGIAATRKQITITQDDIDDEIEDFLDELATEQELTEEDVFALGDTVNINYVGYVVGDYEKYKDGDKFTEYDDVKVMTWCSVRGNLSAVLSRGSSDTMLVRRFPLM